MGKSHEKKPCYGAVLTSSEMPTQLSIGIKVPQDNVSMMHNINLCNKRKLEQANKRQKKREVDECLSQSSSI